MQAFGKLIKHVGTSGAGFAVKAVNNMLLAVNLCAAAEGFTTLKAHGVDLNEALDCINASSGKSNVTETVLPQRVLNRSFLLPLPCLSWPKIPVLHLILRVMPNWQCHFLL